MDIAIQYNRKEIVTELLTAGADVNEALLISSLYIINIVNDSSF